MVVDARSVPDRSTVQTDVCVIGAGAAGITLTREFAGRPFRVCLLESGGFRPDEDTQSLADGKSTGLPSLPLRTARLRCFGGTTNHWYGACRPLTDLDFEARDWIPHSGWPFRKAELEPFYERARSICQLSSSHWEASYWQTLDRYAPLSVNADAVITAVTQEAPDPLKRFGETYRDEVVRAENVTTYLNANVTEIETEETARTVTHLRVACLTGTSFLVAAKVFVLAAGGIENARLLLLSNRIQPTGLGNGNDLVGRFFADHPTFVGGLFRPADSLMPQFYRFHVVANTSIRGSLALSPPAQRRLRVVDVQVRLDPGYDESYVRASSSRGVASIKYLLGKLRQGEVPDSFGKHVGNVIRDLDDVTVAAYWWARGRQAAPVDRINLITRIDPAPNPESRVTLGMERDRLGQRRVAVHWRLSAIDKLSARQALEVIGRELGRAGLGRVEVLLDDNEATWPAETLGSWHHMGTTRMHDDPEQGVVDRHCRVHGMRNLFVAGSSVFPTSGSGTPTLTIVALALRLADRITGLMK